MPIIRCPHCSTSVEIHADDVGYKVLCPSCHSAFQAGDGERPVLEPLPTAPAPEPTAAERSVRCAGCRGAVQVGVEDLGHTVECPLCGEKFRAEEETRSESPRDSERRRAPNRSARFEDDDEDYDNDGEYDGRRRRRRYREEDKAYILDTARSAIAWPANGLMWTGIVSTILCLLTGIGLALAGMYQLENPKPYNQGNHIVFFIYAVMIGIFGTIFHILLAISGYQMKRLRGLAWGYTGGALSIASLVLATCSPTSWAAATFGIWAMVALNKREVKDAIAINTGKRL